MTEKVKKECPNCAGLSWRRGSQDGHVCIGCRKPYRAENLGTVEDYMFKTEMNQGQGVNIYVGGRKKAG